MAAGASGSVVVWEWLNESGRWRPYDPHVCVFIEQSYTNTSQISLGNADSTLHPYILDVQNMVQVRQNTGMRRPVRRTIFPPNSPAALGIMWQWQGDGYNEWHAYDVDVAGIIEDAHQQQKPNINLQYTTAAIPYTVDFNQMTQIRNNTGFSRRIQRVRLPQTYPQAQGSSGASAQFSMNPQSSSNNTSSWNSLGSALSAMSGSVMSAVSGLVNNTGLKMKSGAVGLNTTKYTPYTTRQSNQLTPLPAPKTSAPPVASLSASQRSVANVLPSMPSSAYTGASPSQSYTRNNPYTPQHGVGASISNSYASASRHSGSGLHNPSSGINSTFSMMNPSSSLTNPSHNLMPGSHTAIFGQHNFVSGSHNHMSGPHYPIPGSQNPMTGSHNPVAGSHNPVTGSHNPLQGSHNPGPGSQNPMPGSHSQIPGSQNPVLGSHSHMPGSQNPMLGSHSHMPGSHNLMPGSHNLVPSFHSHAPSHSNQMSSIYHSPGFIGAHSFGRGGQVVKITNENTARPKDAEEVLHNYVHVVGSPPADEDCCICVEKLSDPSGYDDKDSMVLQLEKCKHMFHKACLHAMYESGHKDGSVQCPTCKTIYGEKYGNCPKGIMEYQTIPAKLPGHSDCQTIQILYHIKPGIQGPEHPNPGNRYNVMGFPRRGYLPDNDQGRKILCLLVKAWERRLTFTVGTSTTTGHSDMVTWNEIHHKTELGQNVNGHGYPDPNYFDNVLQELALQGVTE